MTQGPLESSIKRVLEKTLLERHRDIEALRAARESLDEFTRFVRKAKDKQQRQTISEEHLTPFELLMDEAEEGL